MAIPVRIALAFLLAMAASPATALSAETLRFDITRDGLPFGRHVITILRDGERTEVENTAGATVALGPVVLFRYAYRSQETWERDRLRRISAWTNDDGKETTVEAESVGDGLRVTGPGGQVTLPPSVLPTSFWTMAAARSAVFLDTQTGQIAHVTCVPLGTRAGAQGDLLGYRLAGDLDSELWYDARGLLAKARFRARGAVFEYHRTEETPLISSETISGNGGT